MSHLRIELFTTGQMTDPAEGRAFLRALETHLPSWTPRRYGWSQPLRHVYAPERTEHFWGRPSGLDVLWRNAGNTASGEVSRRTGPWDILTKIEMEGRARRDELDRGIGAFMAECGRSLDIAYGMAHIFTDAQYQEYYGNWFALPPDEGVKTARQGTFPYFLRDLYWGNVFGPPYVELFGADRLRAAPAAVADELRNGYFYVQLTGAVRDLCDPAELPGYRAVRDEVKEHLGADCFYRPGADVPSRAPSWRTAVEDGLWTPQEGTDYSPGLRALIEGTQREQ